MFSFLQKVPGLVKDGQPKYIPVKKFIGRLEKVASDEVECIVSGRKSAEKIALTM